jgi:hypothetical protein
MASRFVRPDTTKLTLADGEWLLVRRRLSSGEQRAAFARLYLAGVDGALHVNPLAIGIGQVTSYLIDWSLRDDDGAKVEIRGLSMEELTSVLDTLEPEAFGEIREAIQAHELAMIAERADAKKNPAGTPGSDPTSPSPSGQA